MPNEVIDIIAMAFGGLAIVCYGFWVLLWVYRDNRINRIEKSGHSASRLRDYQRKKLFSK
jgi:hypothetical protein